jgi:hypothetical protein
MIIIGISGEMRSAIIVFIDVLTKTDAGINAFGNDVRQPIVQSDIGLGGGVSDHQLPQHRPQDGFGCVFH